MIRFAPIMLLAGCHTRTEPAEPFVSMGFEGYSVYPIAVGTTLSVVTRWSGSCTDSQFVIPMPGLNEAPRETTSECDIKSYDVEIVCGGSKPGGACTISDEGAPPVDTRLVHGGIRGSHSFEITPFGLEPFGVSVTIRHGRERQVHHLPWAQPVVVRDVIALCRQYDEDEKTARPCDQGVWPAGRSLLMSVRAKDEHLSPNAIWVNGHPQRDHWFLVRRVLDIPPGSYDEVPDGDYEVALRVNPYPYEVERTLTVHVH